MNEKLCQSSTSLNYCLIGIEIFKIYDRAISPPSISDAKKGILYHGEKYAITPKYSKRYLSPKEKLLVYSDEILDIKESKQLTSRPCNTP